MIDDGERKGNNYSNNGFWIRFLDFREYVNGINASKITKISCIQMAHLDLGFISLPRE